MPITGQTPLTTIKLAKEQAITFQPLLLAQLTWPDGTILRLASENLDLSSGGNQYNGFDWKPRMAAQDIGAISAVSDNGIVQSPQVSLRLADADKFLWNEFEIVKGFAGAELQLLFVMWDPDTDSFSNDNQIKFIGICDPPSSDYQYLTITAVNKLNLANQFLPTAQICKQCIWTFPVDKAGRIRAATDEDSAEFACGYSPDVTDSDATGGSAAARGNGADSPFTDCNYTWEDCLARMGNTGLPDTSKSSSIHVQIERDQSNRPTGTFGGIHYDPPDSWRGKSYTSGNTQAGVNQTNDAKFNDYYPQAWGTSFIEPPIMNVVGDPNSTRFEAVICLGQIHDDPSTAGPVSFVIVNDFAVPHVSHSTDVLLEWSWINTGSKFGSTNKGAIYDGRGDPYGSMAAIQVVVPNIVAGSTSVPSVKVLTQGPMVRVWASDSPGDFTRQYTANAAWVLADVLTRCSLAAKDLNLQSFIDASQVSAVQVTYTDLLGQSVAHDRYNLGITLRARRAASDVVTNLLAACKATLVPDNTGRLSLVMKQTLGDQQHTAVEGSNDNDPQGSADATGADKTGRYAYVFDESNILRKENKRDSPTTFLVRQRPTRDTPNKVNVPFQDEDYSYASDSITIVDAEDIGRRSVTVNGGVKAEGVVNVDQAKRIIETQLAEQYRGNPRTGINSTNDTGGTWIAEFETTFKAIYLKVGDIIAISFATYGLDRQAFRIIGVSLKPNAERIAISAQWHEDDWYLDSYGQNPAPLLQARHLNSLLRPPFGWLPNQEAPLNSDSLYDPTELNFAVAQLYSAAKDSTVLVSLQLTGHEPPNKFTVKTGPPYAPGATNDGGGNFPAGHYYFAICAQGSDGLFSAPSFPLAQIDIPVDAAPGQVTIPNIYWLSNTDGYKVYGGTNPNRLSLQGSGGGTPSSITLTDYVRAGEAMPDIQFDHLVYTYKHVWHSGIFGIGVIDFTSTTLTFTGIGFTVDEYAGRTLTILGQVNSEANLPIWNFLVAGNTIDTITLGPVNGHLPDLAALGVQKNDVLIMRAQANIHSPTTIGDRLFINEIKYFNAPITITDASGSPIVLTLATPHNYTSGDEVFVDAVRGNTNANGTYTATVPSTPDASYNKLHLILPPNSNSTYEGGGNVREITNGLRAHDEKGHIVRIIAGTGRNQKRKIVDNDMTTLTVDPEWDVEPDATSVFIVEDSSTLGAIPTTQISNADPTAETVSTFSIDNYVDEVILVQAFSSDVNGNLAVESDSPYREVFVFGGDGTAVVQYDKATFNIATIIDMTVDVDVAPHYIVRRAGTPSSCRAQITIPPTGADAIVDIILTKFDGSFTGSIFGATKIVIPDGSTDLVVMDDTFFADVKFDEDDQLTVNVDQVGSSQAGRVLSIVLKWAVG